ncbi:MAG: phosphatase [Eubacterium sp.]|nr:phosphatase [Eubacterium sp.]
MNFIADMHTHTLASAHAYSTITENAAAAAEKGLKYLGKTDHSLKMDDSPHEWHFANMRAIPAVLNGVRIIKGVEANLVGYNGETDLTDTIRGAVEWVNVSIHWGLLMPADETKHTDTYLAATKDPKTCVLCHTDSHDFPYDYDAVTASCRDNNVLIELNASRLYDQRSVKRLKECILPACVKNGCNIIVNSDAHFWSHIAEFDRAEELLKELDFPEELVINADLQRFEDFLVSKGISLNG